MTVKAYYVREEEWTEVEPDGNRLLLANAGEYHVVYRAESATYTTLLGNPTYAEKDVKILSGVSGDSLAKLHDPNGALPEGTVLMASRIESDSTVYRTAAEKMAAIADRFQVFGVELIAADGNAAPPAGTVTIGLRADSTYNRNQVAAYLLGEDGRLTQLNVSNGGSYVNVKTAQGGTIILCIPGVAFHMPIWGYILIPVGALVLIAGAVMAIVLTVKHKKGQNEPEDVGITAPGSARFSKTAPAGFPAGAVCWLGGRGGTVTVRPESSSETVVGSCRRNPGRAKSSHRPNGTRRANLRRPC